MTEPQAQEACGKLGEQLWYPDSSDGAFIHYLAYQNQSGPYWMAGRQGPSCRSVTATGVQRLQSCLDALPILCTQSAPLSNLTFADNSTQWQTTVTTGQQTITGFRDKYSFEFRGVRYAPEPELLTYSSVYNGTGPSNALAFGEQCLQGSSAVGSSDCLLYVHLSLVTMPL
jgi:hypothetical protein